MLLSELCLNLIRSKGAVTTAQVCNIISMVTVVINIIVILAVNICYFHQYVHGIVGFCTKAKQWPEAKANHAYAYLISARNEEKVIGHLIDSLYDQDYPRDLMQVFVVADNCTDNTAEIARSHGAIVYERRNRARVGKGYALDYALNLILADPEYRRFEAFFIFDADNLVSRSYTYEMNKLFDAGVRVATSFREAKNFGASWASAGQALSFYRESLLIHHSRGRLHMGTYISGTGFFVDRKLIEENGGWKFYTMIEDIEFSLDCAEKNIVIEYSEQAVFYDEQPATLKDSLNQRLRWCKGTHQCCKGYERRLFKKFFRNPNPTTFELAMHVSPLPVISSVWGVIYFVVNTLIVAIGAMPLHTYLYLILTGTVGFMGLIILTVFVQGILCMIRHSRCLKIPAWKKIWYCFTFPVFMAFYLPLLVIAEFKKVEWKEIPHSDETSSVEIH